MSSTSVKARAAHARFGCTNSFGMKGTSPFGGFHQRSSTKRRSEAIALTYSGQLFAHQHVDYARAAKSSLHGNYPRRLLFHHADDAGLGSVNVLSHSRDKAFGDLGRNDGDELSFICDVERIKTKYFARALSFFADGNQLLVNFNANFRTQCN